MDTDRNTFILFLVEVVRLTLPEKMLYTQVTGIGTLRKMPPCLRLFFVEVFKMVKKVTGIAILRKMPSLFFGNFRIDDCIGTFELRMKLHRDMQHGIKKGWSPMV